MISLKEVRSSMHLQMVQKESPLEKILVLLLMKIITRNCLRKMTSFALETGILYALISSSSYDSSSDFALKHLLLFEICARAICEKFVYKHSETVKFVKN